MSYTVQNSIDFSKTFIEYVPLSAGVGNEPAITIANTTQQTICGAPFKWGWNRAEDATKSTIVGTQDYVYTLPDFGFLETVSLTDPSGNTTQVRDIYNTKPLAKANTNQKSRPMAAGVQLVNFGTGFTLRFSSNPEAIYGITIEYQKLAAPITALTGASGTWLIPDTMIDVFNTMFLAEAMQVADDARGAQYRQRAAAALIARADGLSEMDINNFLAQYLSTDVQAVVANLKAQQSTSARGI